VLSAVSLIFLVGDEQEVRFEFYSGMAIAGRVACEFRKAAKGGIYHDLVL
jgi:hypothetical protein